MIRHLLFPLLLLFAFGACAENSQATLNRSILESLSAGKIQSIIVSDKNVRDISEEYVYHVNSFEPLNACGDFDLTLSDVREFFIKARVFNGMRQLSDKSERDKAIRRNGASRCGLVGDLILQDGRKIGWNIDQARNGELLYSAKNSDNNHDSSIQVYCDTCQSKKFYPPAPQNHAAFRPVIKNLVITKNGVQSHDLGRDALYDPDACKDFQLTENEVKEFFRIASPSTSGEFRSNYQIGFCHVIGEAELENGRKVLWNVDIGRRGTIIFHEKKPDDRDLMFFCHDCSEEKFNGLCEANDGCG